MEHEPHCLRRYTERIHEWWDAELTLLYSVPLVVGSSRSVEGGVVIRGTRLDCRTTRGVRQ